MTQDIEAEAKMFDSMVITENLTPGKGLSGIYNTIVNETSISLYNPFLLVFDEIKDTNWTIYENSDAMNAYADYLKNFQSLHSQMQGDPYTGDVHRLMPNAFNNIMRLLINH